MTPVTPQTSLPAHAEQLEGVVSDDKVAEVKFTACEESSESAISLRSDDNLTEQSDTGKESNKGSPVKKPGPGVVYESIETSTEEVCVCVCYVSVCMYTARTTYHVAGFFQSNLFYVAD